MMNNVSYDIVVQSQRLTNECDEKYLTRQRYLVTELVSLCVFLRSLNVFHYVIYRVPDM